MLLSHLQLSHHFKRVCRVCFFFEYNYEIDRGFGVWVEVLFQELLYLLGDVLVDNDVDVKETICFEVLYLVSYERLVCDWKTC